MLLYLKYRYKCFYKQLFCSSLEVVLSKCAHCAVNRCITFYILIMWDLFIGMEVVGGRFYISVLVLFTSFYRWYSMLLLLVAVYIVSLQSCLHTPYIWSGIRMSQFSDWTVEHLQLQCRCCGPSCWCWQSVPGSPQSRHCTTLHGHGEARPRQADDTTTHPWPVPCTQHHTAVPGPIQRRASISSFPSLLAF